MPSATSSYRLAFATLGFGVENGICHSKKDAEQWQQLYSVEFHYYQPWSYAGDCTYDYWGDAYKDAGKIPAENEDDDGFLRQGGEYLEQQRTGVS